MRDKAVTRAFYGTYLGCTDISSADYADYLVLAGLGGELHFFLHKTLNPAENDGQIYVKLDDIDTFYAQVIDRGGPIHANGSLTTKPWGLKEFSMLDPDNNLITFGQRIG